jgi:serine O-acetyltransferase
MSPVLLWRLSAALRRRGHPRLALLVKKLNSAIYHNSLAPAAVFSPDITFGHHGFGTVIHSNVEIGRRVTIWHNVTIAVRAASRDDARIVIEDDVSIGANSVVLAPTKRSLRIGRGARIGAGAVVVSDVPPGATVVCAPSRVIEARPPAPAGEPRGEEDQAPQSAAPAATEEVPGAAEEVPGAAEEMPGGAEEMPPAAEMPASAEMPAADELDGDAGSLSPRLGSDAG